MSPLLRAGAGCAVVLGGLLGSPGAALGDARYDDAFRRSRVLEDRGDLDGAAAALEPLTTVYPEDYFLFLQLGWLHFQREDYRRAEARYERARALSHDGAEPWLGLGWVYLRTDRPVEALEAFDRVLAERPDDPSAREGRALAVDEARPVQLHLDGYTTLHLYPGHPLKRWGFGVASYVDARIGRRVWIGATYRYTVYALRDQAGGGMGPGPGGGGAVVLRQQNEVHARLGVAWPIFGAMAHFAWAQDDTTLSQETWVGGLSFRVSPFGDIYGEASASFVDDAHVLRGALYWALPATDWLEIQPGGSVQRSASGSILPDGSLRLLARRPPWTAWVGGRYGPQERPVYLGLSLIYNTIDRMLGGLYAGFRHQRAGHVRTYAGYEWQALETPVVGGYVRSNAHFLTFGLGGDP